jgi:hypothetical protein
MQRGVETFLVALAIMLLAAVGAMMVYPIPQDSLGFGIGIFALVGAFMLYRVFFWHE